MRLELQPDLSAFETLNPAVASFLEGNDVPKRAAYAVKLALEEVVRNLAEHANGATRVAVELDATPDALRLAITDDGEPFDPREAPALDTAAPLQARNIGGMGLHLVRNMFDEIDYTTEDGTNRLDLALALRS